MSYINTNNRVSNHNLYEQSSNDNSKVKYIFGPTKQLNKINEFPLFNLSVAINWSC